MGSILIHVWQCAVHTAQHETVHSEKSTTAAACAYCFFLGSTSRWPIADGWAIKQLRIWGNGILISIFLDFALISGTSISIWNGSLWLKLKVKDNKICVK